MPITFSVFTKPWRLMSLPALGEHVAGLGFAAIELPVRPGFQVEPANVARGLPEAVRLLARAGVRIASVAGPADEATIMACGEAGVPLIRIMAPIGQDGYDATVSALQGELMPLVPTLDRAGVTIGVQNHSGRYVANALGLRHLLAPFDPRHVAAVWDAAHEALNGIEPEMALEVIWPHLRLVNLKNAFWQRANGPEADTAAWQPYWTTGRHGLASWPRVAAELWRRGYDGTVCLPAEYTDDEAVDRLIVRDLAFARSLFA